MKIFYEFYYLYKLLSDQKVSSQNQPTIKNKYRPKRKAYVTNTRK